MESVDPSNADGTNSPASFLANASGRPHEEQHVPYLTPSIEHLLPEKLVYEIDAKTNAKEFRVNVSMLVQIEVALPQCRKATPVKMIRFDEELHYIESNSVSEEEESEEDLVGDGHLKTLHSNSRRVQKQGKHTADGMAAWKRGGSDMLKATPRGFAQISREVWALTPVTDLAKLAKVGMQLTLALSRLRSWHFVDIFAEQAVDVLRGLSVARATAGEGCNPTEDLSEGDGPPDGEERRWTQLMLRRGVACVCMGGHRFVDADRHFEEILKHQPKEHHAKRALAVIGFLRKQLAPHGQRRVLKASMEDHQLEHWADAHASDGKPLRAVGDGHRQSRVGVSPEMRLALEELAASI